MEEETASKKRVHDETPDFEIVSPYVKRLRDDLLDSLEDDSEIIAMSNELNSFIKSFEEEIKDTSIVEDTTSDSRLDLFFLLGYSDDELGLPPLLPSTTPEDSVVAGDFTYSELFELGTSDFDGQYDDWEMGQVISHGHPNLYPPNSLSVLQISRKWTHYNTTSLFRGFDQ